MIKNRFLAILLALVIILGTIQVPSALAAGNTPFTDVHAGDWYADAVQYVYETSLMVGTSRNKFSPNSTTTRGQVVTILYRMDGSPSTSSACNFTDVEPGSWYENAVIWGTEHKIVAGKSATTYAPNSSISREETAAMLYRYSAYKGYSTDNLASLGTFTDSGRISSWAEIPMKWAVGGGLLYGVSSNAIAPKQTATRAQIAAILMRFCRKQDAFAKFKEKDIEDFPNSEVINLDDSNDTNFAVLGDDSVKIESKGNSNQLINPDSENGVYVFTNINGEMSSLKPGDILYHIYGDGAYDYLLLKVGDIKISGNTATITEGTAQLSDFFEYIDIDIDVDLSEDDYRKSGLATASESNGSNYTAATEMLKGSAADRASVGSKFKFGFSDSRLSLTGESSITLNVEIHFCSFLNLEEAKLSVKTQTKATGSLKQELLNHGDGKPLYEEETTPVKFKVIPGVMEVDVSAYWQFDIKATVKGGITATIETESGTIYRDGKAIDINESDAAIDCTIGGDISGSFGVGVKTSLVAFKFLRVGLRGEGGIEAKGEAKYPIAGTDKKELHDCNPCVDGSIEPYAKLTVDGKLGLSSKRSIKIIDIEIAKVTFVEKNFYISNRIENGQSKQEFGWGKCPHKRYLITVNVKDKSGKKLDGIKTEVINLDTGRTDEAGQTNKNGQFQAYCSTGKYRVCVIVPAGYTDNSAAEEITLTNKGAVVTLILTPKENLHSSGITSKVTVSIPDLSPQVLYYNSKDQVICCVNFPIKTDTGDTYWDLLEVVTFEYTEDGHLKRSRCVHPTDINGRGYLTDFWPEYAYDTNSNEGVLDYVYKSDCIEARTTDGSLWRRRFLDGLIMGNESAHYSYSYDDNGRIFQIDSGWGINDHNTWDLSVNNDGNITRSEDELGYEINTFEYDGNGRMVTANCSFAGHPYSNTFSYDSQGELTEIKGSSYTGSENMHFHDYSFSTEKVGGKTILTIKRKRNDSTGAEEEYNVTLHR